MKGEFCHSCGSQLITKKVEIGEGASINSEGLMEELRGRESLFNVLDNFWISNHTNFLDRETYFDSRESEGVLISLYRFGAGIGKDGIQLERRKFKERYKDTEVSNFIDTDAWEEIEEKEDEDRQEIMKAVDSLRN